MDTISLGGTIACAMEAKAKGMLDDQGLGLAYGDGNRCCARSKRSRIAVASALLAEGSLKAAEDARQADVDMTVTTKGQEMPATCRSTALARADLRRGIRSVPITSRPSTTPPCDRSRLPARKRLNTS